MKQFIHSSRSAFTLVELLVVLAIIGLLASMITVGMARAKNAAKRTQARAEVRQISSACQAYLLEYGKLPIPNGSQGNDEPAYLADGDDSKDVIQALNGRDNGAIPNPKEIVFLESQRSATDGTFLDPWGNQYIIKFDADYNGRVSFPNGAQERINSVAVACSYGENGEFDTTANSYGDDIVSSQQ